MKGLIMAGGEGTRLRPLTCGKPKPMIDVMGKPVMEHIIELMRDAGIKDIAVTLMYMPHIITDYFGDGKKFGVNLHYFVEESPLGTAGSVKNAQSFLDSPFIIISGDSLTDIDINTAIQFHRSKKSEATLVLTKVDNPLEYGIVVTNENGKIVRFLEKPSWSEVFSDTANTGTYILQPSVLDRIPEGVPFDFSKDLYPKMLADDRPMFGHVASGYWCDIGDLNAYRNCHFDILDKKVKVSIDTKEKDGMYIQPGAIVEQGAQIMAPCYIGEGAVIKSGSKILPYSVIGNDSRVSEGTSVKQSVIQKNVSLSKNVQIRGSIIADGVIVGRNSIVLENSVIGENTQIGDMCEVKTNIKIWPAKKVESERIVGENLIWGDNFSRRLFGENGVSGEINVSVTPEFATRLGAAFAVASGKNAQLSVSCGRSGALEMLKNAFVSGMLSSGAKVFDFGEIALPVARRAIPFYGLKGGLHLVLEKGGDDLRLSVTFMGKEGTDITRDAERKLEGLYMREDFMRCEPTEISSVTKLYDYKYYYIREIINEIKTKLNLNVYVEGGDGLIEEIANDLDIKLTNHPRNGIISAFIDDYAERLVINDERGRTISGEKYFALTALTCMLLESPKIVVPFSSSDEIIAMAEKYNATTVRCKTEKSQLMSCMQEHNPTQYRMMYDAPYALAKLSEVIQKKGISLADLVDQIPDIHIIEREVVCDMSKKGTVIREIANNFDKSSKGKKIEMEEGVKIIHENGWVLVIPHAQKPVCRVISEGFNEEFAEELCDFYTKEVEKYTNDELE